MKNGDKYILLTFSITEEDGQFAARCKELGTVSCGDTFEEARDNIADAVVLHVNTLEELGDRARVFRENKIRVKTYQKPKREVSVSFSAPAGTWATREKVPVTA